MAVGGVTVQESAVKRGEVSNTRPPPTAAASVLATPSSAAQRSLGNRWQEGEVQNSHLRFESVQVLRWQDAPPPPLRSHVTPHPPQENAEQKTMLLAMAHLPITPSSEAADG